MEETKYFENPESLELVYKGTNGQALTTSLMVAKKFGKEHKNVLSAIRDLLNTTAKIQLSLIISNLQRCLLLWR